MRIVGIAEIYGITLLLRTTEENVLVVGQRQPGRLIDNYRYRRLALRLKTAGVGRRQGYYIIAGNRGKGNFITGQGTVIHGAGREITVWIPAGEPRNGNIRQVADKQRLAARA